MADDTPKAGDLPGDYPSEYERKLMQRILTATTEFPVEFRNWLKRYIEQLDIGGEGSSSGGGASGFDPRYWPAGIILDYAGAGTIPNSLPCNGAEVSRLTYAALFTAIGTIWGAGDGSTTFRVPDTRDRALYGQGGVVSLAGTDGASLGTRGPKHHHDLSGGGMSAAGSHDHGGGVGGNGGHTHAGSFADMGGDHQHSPANGPAFASTSGGTFTHGTGSQSRFLITDFGPTAFSGPHNHTLSITAVGDHGHSISADGSHTHTLTGSISGGGVLDAPGYAGVLHLITTGVIS